MRPQNAVAIPLFMQHLPRDPRGYPIPAMVWRDSAGTPHFTINDEEKRQAIISEKRCSICGGKLYRAKWFVGGPLSAMHVHGRYIDPAMHRECAEYALAVCPYLAAPKYMGRIDDRKVSQDDKSAVFVDPTMIPERPDLFVLLGVTDYTTTPGEVEKPGLGLILGHKYIEPTGRHVGAAFWKHGRCLPYSDGHMEAMRIVVKSIAQQGGALRKWRR